jgi:hypothetical protein
MIFSNFSLQLLVQEIHDCQKESELQQVIAETEMRETQKKIQHYNLEQLVEVPTEREEGTMRIIVCQMGGWASPEMREIKIAATEKLIQKYDINLCLFMELNFNWSKVNSSANLASWFMNKERETRCVTAYNIKENDELLRKHQPGGTGMLCRHKYLQYTRKPTMDPRGLGRRCSWPFFCKPMHVTRIIIADLCAIFLGDPFSITHVSYTGAFPKLILCL